MRCSTATLDGFRTAYHHRPAAGEPTGTVVLLHGWPGDHSDYRRVLPHLDASLEVIVPDLRGFGRTQRPADAPAEAFHAAGQARQIAALIEELTREPVVLGGYDIGSRIAQELTHQRPELVRRLVLSPPLPGIGARLIEPDVEPYLWYLGFHRSGLAEAVLDGNHDRVRAYLEYFWNTWSGPDFSLDVDELEQLVDVYSAPGAFAASVRWYQAGPGFVAASRGEAQPAEADRLKIPTDVLWPDRDPVFPRRFSDRLDAFFTQVRLHTIDGPGHFIPVEAPEAFARLLNAA